MADSPGSASPDIAELYHKAIIMDSLCGLYAPGAPPTAGQVAAARQSGITAINNTKSEDSEDPFENLEELARRWRVMPIR
jgi:hypothetical protein